MHVLVISAILSNKCLKTVPAPIFVFKRYAHNIDLKDSLGCLKVCLHVKIIFMKDFLIICIKQFRLDVFDI